MADTLRELIDRAKASEDWDAVADWCEQFDWADATGLPAAELYLELAAEAAADATEQQTQVTGEQLLEAVAAARCSGVSWERIGQILGMTSQAAQQRYEIAAKIDEMAAP